VLITTSLTLLVLGFEARRPLNQTFAAFTFLQGTWAFINVLLRLSLWFQRGDPGWLLEMGILPYCATGPFLLMFTVRYLELDKRWADRAALLGLSIITILSVPLFMDRFILNPRLLPNGTMVADVTGLGVAAGLVPLIYYGWPLILLWRESKSFHEPYILISVLFLEIGLILGGILQVGMPIISITNFISVAILGYGVLSKQLFNPLRNRTIELQAQISERTRVEEALRRNEARLRTLLAAIPDVIITFGPDGEIIEIFSQVNTFTSSDRIADQSRHIQELLPKSATIKILEVLERAIQTKDILEYEYGMPGPEGIDWFQARVVAYEGIEGPRVIWLARDITKAKQAELARQQSEARYQNLFENIPIGIYRTNREGKVLVANPALIQLLGFSNFEELSAANIEEAGLIDRNVRQTFVDQIERDGYVRGLVTEWYRKDHSTIYIRESAQLVHGDDGQVYYEGSVEDISEQVKAHTLLEKTNIDLAQAYDATLEGWSRALELRERETAGHSQRVVSMTLELSQAMGVADEDLVHIRRGTLLHDIGKMGIPDSILLKPSALTDDEWIIMKQHPLYAYQLLAPIPYLKPALDIPYAHHERWDGSGYPNGLRGEAIPLAARIFAVVDVWDALSSDRPYRPAWTEKAVIHYLKSQAGRLFDPQVVKKFLQIL
jgi:PAS domain S-box-containing protein